jgi:hypothetical protein
MKKPKLKIHKETLRQLSTPSLERVGGGDLSVASNPAWCAYTKLLSGCHSLCIQTCVNTLCHC